MSTISPLVRPSKTVRSRVTNGSTLHLGEVDGRSALAKRFRDVLAEIVSDLGGAEGLSEGQRQLARRAALLSVECEALEGKSVAGEPIDLDQFVSLTDKLGRVFNRLGLKRVAKAISNPIADHFSQPYRPESA